MRGERARGQGVGVVLRPMVPYAVPLLRENRMCFSFVCSSPWHCLKESERETMYGFSIHAHFLPPFSISSLRGSRQPSVCVSLGRGGRGRWVGGSLVCVDVGVRGSGMGVKGRRKERVIEICKYGKRERKTFFLIR